jgi:copper chaperone CopZ
VTRQIFRITGMHCTSCAMSIDMDLEDLAGVSEAKTSFARSTTEVVFDPTRVDVETIVRTIGQAGYEAHPVT